MKIFQVTGVIIESGDKILLAKRGPNISMPNLWEFPGGKLKKGETEEACLVREIKEEMNVDIKVGEFLPKDMNEEAL